jgi:hypothetical protein
MKPLTFSDVLALAPVPCHRESLDDSVTECYENRIPPFVDAELKRLYRSIFSSLPQFRIHGGAEHASVYVARQSARLSSVLLYRAMGREVDVVNQCVRLEQEEISRFADFIFRRLPGVDSIRFHSVDIRLSASEYPTQISRCSEDFVLNLPATVDEYYSRLGKSTRSYLNRYLNKAKRTHPSFTFEAFAGSDIRKEDVYAIFEMNRARMAERGFKYGYHEDFPERTVQLLKEVGLLCAIRIDGEICAGTVLYCVEGEYYLEVLGHKAEFNDIGLGTLCCYLSICECIRREGRAYHFLWGRYDYKIRLGGMERPLSDVVVYRSWLHLMKHGIPALKRAARGYAYQAKTWVQAAAERDQPLACFLNRILRHLRTMRARATA